MNVDDIVFLDVDDVIELHANQLELFGGGAGLRDQGLLESSTSRWLERIAKSSDR